MTLSDPVKKISLKMSSKCVFGMKFLDKNDNELSKWENSDSATWEDAIVIPDGWEVIGVYGDTRQNASLQFGLLIWNPRWASQN